jgi:hypothetical protein
VPNAVALALAGLLALASFLALRRARDQANLLRTVLDLRPTSIASEGRGLQLIRGRLEGDPLLISPLQQRPCVYYFFRIHAPRPGKKPKPVATGKEWTMARVRDESGAAGIEPWTAVVASPRRHEAHLRDLRTIPPGLENLFERAGIEERHLPRLPELVVHEYTLEPGDEIYVLGSVRGAGTNKTFHRKKRRPLAVMAEPPAPLLAPGLRAELVLHASLAALLLAAALAVAAVAYLAP